MIRNLEKLRTLRPKDAPDLGVWLYEALTDIAANHQTLAQQVNGNSTGQPAAPPAVQKVVVTAQNGHFNAQIHDQGPIYRGIQYYIEHSDNRHFTNPTVVHLGDSRSWDKFLGNVTRYFRAYSSYASSPPSAPAYHGGQLQPAAVTGGGTNEGPSFQVPQGSGTGGPQVGLQGPGTLAFRAANGVPPIR